LATQWEGKGVFKGVSPLRLDTKALHKVVYKTFKNKPKYTLYMERLCTRLCTKLYAELCTEFYTELSKKLNQSSTGSFVRLCLELY